MKVTDITTNVKFPKYSVKGDNGKSVVITDYKSCWQVKYPNGLIKNFSDYIDAIQYLQKKGY